MPAFKPMEVVQLRERLFDAPERWGWQFQNPEGPRPHPAAATPPQLRVPSPPDIYDLQMTYDKGREGATKHGLIVGVVALFGLSSISQSPAGLFIILVAVGLGAFWFWPMINASQQIAARQAEYETSQNRAGREHQSALQKWQADVSAWDASEQRRISEAMLWFPLRPRSASARLEIFGGTPEGWSSFLLTMGAGVLNAGKPLLVVDLSENDVSRALWEATAQGELPTRRQDLPAQLDRADLLQGLTPEDIAEIVAEALHTRRAQSDLASRLLDADILKGIAGRLDAPVTFAKLAAALRILQGSTETAADDASLSGVEMQRIVGYVDLVGDSDRVTAQIQEQRSTLESLLEARRTGDDSPQPKIGEAGLTLLVTDDANARRRDVVDRLVVQALLHRLRQNPAGLRGGVLVIAGADHLGMETLEALGRAARRADVRLFLLIEHLREEFEPFLGGSDSAAIFMRMGNSREAARAAEHIGRGHTFQLTQLSRQSGTTLTQGTSTTEGTNESTALSSGRSGSHAGRGWSESATETRGTSSQFGTNESTARSETEGVTESRVYEFTVEPTRFQDLDPNAFILVQPLPSGGRRVAAGTCDPQVVTLTRVSETEFDEAAPAPLTPGAFQTS